MTEFARRTGATISAICLGIAGAVLLFAPRETSNVLMPGSPPVLMQLIAAALLGFGVANWTARGAALGGIYGRAIVAGNQAHFMIGAVVLLTHRREVETPHPAFWAFTILYVIGAAYFSYLMFFSSGLKGR
jgi:drug/metabolite transporter (DMT)-like permease